MKRQNTCLVLFAVLLVLLPPAELAAQQFSKNTNQSRKLRSVIAGGSGNVIEANTTAGVISGGRRNRLSSPGTPDGEGYSQDSSFSVIAGGRDNFIRADVATIGGGHDNMIYNDVSTIAGGKDHVAAGEAATISGGEANSATNDYASVGGGLTNVAGGAFSVVPGGTLNAAKGDYSFAAGHRAKANLPGQFVWADSQDVDFAAGAPNGFAVRAQGGVVFTSGQGGDNQTVSWAPGGGSWSFTSDAATKENVRQINPREILRRLTTVPITEWNYIGYGQRHIGPMAQDWHAAFPISTDEKTVNTAHLHGISLAAIQGLVEELKERDGKIEQLEAQNAEVQAELSAIRKQLSNLPPQ